MSQVIGIDDCKVGKDPAEPLIPRVEGTGKFMLLQREPVTLLNGANSPNQDVLVSNLETDSGDLQTWIVVDGPLGAEIPEPQAQLSQAAQ